MSRDTLKAFTDAAADAVAREIARLQRDAAREAALRDAQVAAALARLEAATQRAAALRDGRDGADGKDGRDGLNGVDGAPGRDGERGLPGEPGRDGADGREGPAGRDGLNGADGVNGRDGVDGANGRDGKDGTDGERGPEGPPGKLPMVRAWTDGVHYEADVVTHGGALWQARTDTGREPPHEDWLCIVAAGRDGSDGRSMAVRGTWAEGEEYRHLDVVALNGASFVAKTDNPGSCPGDGWQMVASQGKRGNPGERGLPGARGDAGRAGPSVLAMDVDEYGTLTLTNSDGSQVTLDLYPLLSRIARRG